MRVMDMTEPPGSKLPDGIAGSVSGGIEPPVSSY
jgi:hypothetical protein